MVGLRQRCRLLTNYFGRLRSKKTALKILRSVVLVLFVIGNFYHAAIAPIRVLPGTSAGFWLGGSMPP